MRRSESYPADPMAWIRTLSDSEASPELASLFAANTDPSAGKLDEIMRIHSLHPRGLEAHALLYESVMTGSKSLRKVERELIAFVVSTINECHY